jgi:hypothetical protein
LDLKDNIYNKADATFFDQGWKDRPDDKERNIRTFAFQPGNDDQSNRFYQVMAQTFSDQTKLTDFKNYILNSTIYSDKSVAEKAVNDASEYCTNLFNFYTEKTKERFSVTKIKENEKYKNLIKNPINETTSYKLNYVLTTAGTDQQKTRITELYSTNNVNANPKTFDGKIKFN